MRTRIRRSTPRSCCSSSSARSAHRSCFARSGQAWHGWARARSSSSAASRSTCGSGAVARGLRRLHVERDELGRDVAPVPGAARASRSRQRDPRQHDRRFLEVLRREPEERPVLRRARVGLPSREDTTTASPRRLPWGTLDHLARAAASGTASRTRVAHAPRSRPRRSSSRIAPGLRAQRPVRVEVAEVAHHVRAVALERLEVLLARCRSSATTPRSARNCANDEFSRWWACSRV